MEVSAVLPDVRVEGAVGQEIQKRRVEGAWQRRLYEIAATIFDMTHYPETPGFKTDGPSLVAALNVAEDAATLRAAVLDSLDKHGPATADECAARLNRSILSVRPRFSELRAAGKIGDSGERRRNSSGHTATVWRCAGVLVQADLIAA